MVASTGFSGLFDTIQPTGHATLDTDPQRKRLSKMLNKEGARKLNELIITLNGAAAGATALSQYSRVQHVDDVGNPAAHGGSRVIEVIDAVNRATTAADETGIDDILTENFAPDTYIEDASGNGGGGKLNEESTL